MNHRLLFVIALMLAVALPLAISAQDKKDSGSVSITGCFNKGADADHYVIKDDKTGKETVVTGDVNRWFDIEVVVVASSGCAIGCTKVVRIRVADPEANGDPAK